MRNFFKALGTFAVASVAAAAGSGVISSDNKLPPLEGAYHGTSPHLFLGGQATLFCGSHGTISGNQDPPKKKGETKDIAYGATFIGELVLSPPLAPETRTYALHEPIRMVERVTFRGVERGVRVYDTELVALHFLGTGLPPGVQIRTSRTHPSLGETRIARLPRRMFAIHTRYEVWLEISLDDGRTWNPQMEVVVMFLGETH